MSEYSIGLWKNNKCDFEKQKKGNGAVVYVSSENLKKGGKKLTIKTLINFKIGNTKTIGRFIVLQDVQSCQFSRSGHPKKATFG